MAITSNNPNSIYYSPFGRTGNSALPILPPVEPLYVEDVFSTDLYTGGGLSYIPGYPTALTINNDIDLLNSGGMVWIKNRTYSPGRVHSIYDSERPLNTRLRLPNMDEQQTLGASGTITFNNNGFTMELGDGDINQSSFGQYAAWTFRKAPKFFDVVTYVGDGISGKAISHNLGSVPGCIIVKRTSATEDWWVYHRIGIGYGTGRLNTDQHFNSASPTAFFTSTSPNETEFYVGSDTGVNDDGSTYVAYLFAHDAGGFGETGTDSIVSCGSFTTDGSGNATVNIGWEPQWILIKPMDNSQNWLIIDTKRGMSSIEVAPLYSNTSGTENPSTGQPYFLPNANGFTSSSYFTSLECIYVAIRRGPMKTPNTSSDCFYIENYGAGISGGYIGSGASNVGKKFRFLGADMVIHGDRAALGINHQIVDKLRGYGRSKGTAPSVQTSISDGETSASTEPYVLHTDAEGASIAWGSIPNGRTSAIGMIQYAFIRHPKFFDVVCYTGAGNGTVVNHSLGVNPELVIIKNRNSNYNWFVWNSHQPNLGIGHYLNENTGATFTGLTVNSTSFTFPNLNSYLYSFSGEKYVAYLFATLAGVSKVGVYQGTGSAQNIDCGFGTKQSQFVLIRRITGGSSDTGDWLVYDSSRGIGSGDDPYFRLNLSNTAEQSSTNYLDNYNGGFALTDGAIGDTNSSGVYYMFLAIAKP